MPKESEQLKFIERVVEDGGLDRGIALPDNYAALLLSAVKAKPNFAGFAQGVGEYFQEISESNVDKRVLISAALANNLQSSVARAALANPDGAIPQSKLDAIARLVDQTVAPETIFQTTAAFSANKTNLEFGLQQLERFADALNEPDAEPTEDDYLALLNMADQLKALFDSTDTITKDMLNNTVSDKKAQEAIRTASETSAAFGFALQKSRVGLKEVRFTGARKKSSTQSEDEEAALVNMSNEQVFQTIADTAPSVFLTDVVAHLYKWGKVLVVLYGAYYALFTTLAEMRIRTQDLQALANQDILYETEADYRANATFLEQLLIGGATAGYLDSKNNNQFIAKRGLQAPDIDQYRIEFVRALGKAGLSFIRADPTSWGVLIVVFLVTLYFRNLIGASYKPVKLQIIRSRRTLRNALNALRVALGERYQETRLAIADRIGQGRLAAKSLVGKESDDDDDDEDDDVDDDDSDDNLIYVPRKPKPLARSVTPPRTRRGPNTRSTTRRR